MIDDTPSSPDVAPLAASGATTHRWPVWARRTVVIGGALLLLFVLAWAGLVIAALTSMKTPYDGKAKLEFTREAWLAGQDDWDGSRYLMLDDLAARHPLTGMTRTQVLELLGPMQPPGYPVDFGDCYYLGPENHSMAVDNAWLVLTLENDVVKSWRLATD